MKKNGNKSKALILAAFLSIPTSAFANWYVGLDATNLDYEVKFITPEVYDLNPARLKLGYLGESGLGIELQVLGSSDAQTIDGNGNLFRTDLDSSLGISAIWSTTKDGFGVYGSFGFISFDTTYGDVRTGTSVQDKVPLSGFSLGAHYKVNDNFKLTLDYSYYGAEAAYNIFATNGEEVDTYLKGIGVGASYTF
jgi:hypothetical protein